MVTCLLTTAIHFYHYVKPILPPNNHEVELAYLLLNRFCFCFSFTFITMFLILVSPILRECWPLWSSLVLQNTLGDMVHTLAVSCHTATKGLPLQHLKCSTYSLRVIQPGATETFPASNCSKPRRAPGHSRARTLFGCAQCQPERPAPPLPGSQLNVSAHLLTCSCTSKIQHCTSEAALTPAPLRTKVSPSIYFLSANDPCIPSVTPG